MADRGRAEYAAEIATANLADLLRREALIQHLADDRVVETNLLVRPSLVRSSTAPPSPL